VAIVCEIQKAYEEGACQAFRQIRISKPISNPDRPYRNSIQFIPKDSSVLTQPSDFLAYAMAEHIENPNSAKAKLCQAILGPPGVPMGVTLTRDYIRRIIRGAAEIFQRWQ
jgi:hypothetical protein